jgi:hypothetical protein
MTSETPAPSVKNVSVTTHKAFNQGNLLQQLAREALPYGIEASRVQSLFETELATLQATARIEDFLPVLVTRKVRAAFKHLGTRPIALGNHPGR